MTRTEPYHHTNLRQTLLDAAVALIGEVRSPRIYAARGGPTRRRLAQCTLSSFCQQGRTASGGRCGGVRSAYRVDAEEHSRATSPRERLQECGCGYVAFALRWPQHFLVMFDLPHAPHGQEKQHAAGQNAFAVLEKCIAAAQQSGIFRLAIRCLWRGRPGRLFTASPNWPSAEIFPSAARSTIEFTRNASQAIFSGMKAGSS